MLTETATPSASDLNTFLAAVQAIVDAHFVLEFDKPGPRFIRVVKRYRNPNGTATGRSVFCFVERATGAIHKAASFKAVAPNGVRGHISAPERCIGEWGLDSFR